jgi:HSP20 family protein
MKTTDTTRSPQQQAQQQPGGSPSSTQQHAGSASPSSRQQDQYAPSHQQAGGTAQNSGASDRQGRSVSDPQGDRAAMQRGSADVALPSLWARSPFELMRRLDEDMDRLFGQLWGGGRGRNFGTGLPQMWVPQIEVFEDGGKVHVHADLPGMKKEDIKVSVDENQIVIEGERRSEHEDREPQQGGWRHSERSYGSFYRALALPEGVDPTKIDASFKDGVLDVSFDAPKAPPSQSRRIDIRDGS